MHIYEHKNFEECLSMHVSVGTFIGLINKPIFMNLIYGVQLKTLQGNGRTQNVSCKHDLAPDLKEKPYKVTRL